jgi:hypothetical protein
MVGKQNRESDKEPIWNPRLSSTVVNQTTWQSIKERLPKGLMSERAERKTGSA